MSVWLQGVRRYVNTLSIKKLGVGEAVIVLHVLGVKSYHIILCSLWVMCLVSSFLSGVYRFARRTDRVRTLAVIHVKTKKAFVN